MHGPMSGFIKKYFGNFQYVHQDASLEIQAPGGLDTRCAVPSAAPSPDNFLQWFSEYMSREIDGARGSWQTSGGDVAAPEHESADGGASLLLSMPTSPASNAQTRWGPWSGCWPVLPQWFSSLSGWTVTSLPVSIPGLRQSTYAALVTWLLHPWFAGRTLCL
jgi:hypothetical protein